MGTQLCHCHHSGYRDGTVLGVGTQLCHCHHGRCGDGTVSPSLLWVWGHRCVTATIVGIGMALCWLWGHSCVTVTVLSIRASLCHHLHAGYGDITVSLPPYEVQGGHCVGCGDPVVSPSPCWLWGCPSVAATTTVPLWHPMALSPTVPPLLCPPTVRLQPGDVHPHAVNEIALSLNNKNPRWGGGFGVPHGGGWVPYGWDLGSHMVRVGVPHGSDLGSHMVRVGVPHGWDLGSHMVGVGVRYGWDLGYHEDEIWGVLWEGIGVLHR